MEKTHDNGYRHVRHIASEWDIGWTEAQEMNAEGYSVWVTGLKANGDANSISIKGNTDELTFNTIVREFIKNHDDCSFSAHKTGDRVWEGDEAKTCDFCGRVSTPERIVTDFNGWELCPDCWLTDPRALNRPRKEISIDNGLTWVEPEEAIKQKDWAVIAHYMEDEAREKVHNEMAPCTDLEFLKRYLEVAENDLVIG